MATAFSATTRTVPGAVQDALAEATAHHCAGRLGDAERLYREILRLGGRNAEALHGLGLVAQQVGNLPEAARLMRAAIGVDLRSAIYRSNLGNVLQMQGLLGEAVAEYERALVLLPDSAAALSNLGAALLLLDRAQEAETRLRRAAQLLPGSAQVLDNLGNALQALGRLEEAVACHEQALAIAPEHPQAHGNLGLALASLGRWDAAMSSFERALELDPENAGIHLARAQLELLLGDFARGLVHYEWRKRVHGRRRLKGREWSGEPIAPGETLLLYAEQGLGDTVQFLRFVPLVEARTGAKTVLEVQEPMRRLALGVPGRREVVAAGEALPEFGRHCSLMSLPLILFGDATEAKTGSGPNPLELAGAVPYLSVPEEAARKAEGWIPRRQNDESDGTLRVGLVWAGNPAHVRDRFRSIPFSLLDTLRTLEGVGFYSLQLGEAAANGAGKMADLSGVIEDMADTAALIDRLDLVIGVDSAVAHLAGALGRPVWTLLPFWPDWRWGLEREDCNWYPTMRLFRQRSPGDWDGVVEAVRAALLGEVRKAACE